MIKQGEKKNAANKKLFDLIRRPAERSFAPRKSINGKNTRFSDISTIQSRKYGVNYNESKFAKAAKNEHCLIASNAVVQR